MGFPACSDNLSQPIGISLPIQGAGKQILALSHMMLKAIHIVGLVWVCN